MARLNLYFRLHPTLVGGVQFHLPEETFTMNSSPFTESYFSFENVIAFPPAVEVPLYDCWLSHDYPLRLREVIMRSEVYAISFLNDPQQILLVLVAVACFAEEIL